MKHMSKPPHFALSGQLQNEGNPTVVTLPNGWDSKLLLLDDTNDPQKVNPADPTDPENWWPKAPHRQTRAKLLKRVIREGYVLPIVVSLGLALLGEMYTTTSAAGSTERRTRLKYRSSPIADFGIAKGSARVTNQDKLAYVRLSDGRMTRGQDPDEHYWLYFTTIRGEELILDFGMYTWNMCTFVHT